MRGGSCNLFLSLSLFQSFPFDVTAVATFTYVYRRPSCTRRLGNVILLACYDSTAVKRALVLCVCYRVSERGVVEGLCSVLTPDVLGIVTVSLDVPFDT